MYVPHLYRCLGRFLRHFIHIEDLPGLKFTYRNGTEQIKQGTQYLHRYSEHFIRFPHVHRVN